MPDSEVIRTMRQWKADLLRGERAQMQEMATRWLHVERRLHGQMDALAMEMAQVKRDGGTVAQETLYSSQRYRELLTQLQQEMEPYSDYVERTITDRQRQLARLGTRHAAQAIKAQGVTAGFNRLPVEAVQNMVGFASDGSPLNRLLMMTWPDAAIGMSQELVNGVALGYNPRKVAKMMANGATGSLNRMMVIARTEQLRTYRTANLESYKASGVVESYQRLCAHDSRVCAACLMDEGHVYTLDEEMPEHPQGRCTLVPVVEGMPPLKWKQGQEWFEEQDPATQKDILGKGRYYAWQNGDFALGDLVTVVPNPVWGDSLQVTPLGQLASGRAAISQLPLAPPQWSPSMSRATAERWAVDSAYKDDVFHVTKGVANERSIKANGFDLSRLQFGRMWGDGVYVGADQDTADVYKKWAGPAARTLKIKLNVQNPFVYRETISNFKQADIVMDMLGLPDNSTSRIKAVAMIRDNPRGLSGVLSDAGYDALHIVPKDGGISRVGGNQLIVFDPKNVVVIND